MFKIKWNEDKITYLVLRLILIVSAILFFKIFYSWGATISFVKATISLLSPFIVGFLIAFLMNPGVMKVERLITKLFYSKSSKSKVKISEEKLIKRNKNIRMQAITYTYIIVTFMVLLIMRYIVPQLFDSIYSLSSDLPQFISGVLEEINSFALRLSKDSTLVEGALTSLLDYIPSLLDTAKNFLKEVLPGLLSTSISITSSIFDLIMAFIISIYYIADKERFIRMGKKITYAVLNEKNAKQFLLVASECNRTFKRFFVGKALDSFIIGVICFVLMKLFNFPYELLISVIVGITNMIPYFGPFIGAIPGFIIILFVSPIKAFFFLLLILALQQFDGIILGPRILGESVGIRPVWIIFSIIVGGGLFGFTGMLLGVPTFSVIYNITRRLIDRRLENKLINPEDIE